MRHGLLTDAFLRTLQEVDAPAIDVTAATASILERVRAAAAQLGVTQTPVMWGHIEGGLTLPRLTPGPRFFAPFPESVGVRCRSARTLRRRCACGSPQNQTLAITSPPRYSGPPNRPPEGEMLPITRARCEVQFSAVNTSSKTSRIGVIVWL